MPFYPDDAPVPTELRSADFQLQVLRPKHVELDYDAFTSSRERCLLWSGGYWPAADYTVERNLRDMHYHEDRFNARTQFTYTVLSPDGTRCEGCVYIDPLEDYLKEAVSVPNDIDADQAYTGIATYWVRDNALERDLDRQLLAGLRGWLNGDAWQFERVLYRANQLQARDIHVFEDAGLERRFTVEIPDEGGLVHFYAEPDENSREAGAKSE
jgi:hypothetical protein